VCVTGDKPGIGHKITTCNKDAACTRRSVQNGERGDAASLASHTCFNSSRLLAPDAAFTTTPTHRGGRHLCTGGDVSFANSRVSFLVCVRTGSRRAARRAGHLWWPRSSWPMSQKVEGVFVTVTACRWWAVCWASARPPRPPSALGNCRG
jgi:hypothetical protein